jgi:hypothetical protein
MKRVLGMACALAFAACGGGGSEDKLDGGGGPVVDGGTVDADVAVGDGVELRVSVIEAIPASAAPIRCNDPDHPQAECLVNTEGAYETKHATVRLSGTVQAADRGPVTLQMNGEPVDVTPEGGWTFEFHASSDCSVPLLPSQLTFTALAMNSTKPAERTVAITADICPPVASWPDGSAERPFDRIDDELSYVTSFSTVGYVPCLWRHKTPTEPETTVLNPTTVPSIQKYQANLDGEPANLVMRGETSAGPNTNGCQGVAFASPPPSSATYEVAGANPIRYSLGIADNYVRFLTIRAVVTTPSGVTHEAQATFAPSPGNPLSTKSVGVFVTARTRPAVLGEEALNVVVDTLDQQSGEYALDVDVTDARGWQTTVPTVRWYLERKSGPISPPVAFAVPVSGDLLGMSLLTYEGALAPGRSFLSFTQSSSTFAVKNVKIFNRTRRPLTITFAETDAGNFHWRRWRRVRSSQSTFNSSSVVDINPPPWSGSSGQEGNSFIPRTVRYVATGGTCADGCRVITVAGFSDASVAVGMSGFTELNVGTMRTISNGLEVYATKEIDDVPVSSTTQWGSFCDVEAPACPANYACTRFENNPEPQPDTYKCRTHRIATVDYLWALEEIHAEALGTWSYSVSSGEPAETRPLGSSLFNGSFQDAVEVGLP